MSILKVALTLLQFADTIPWHVLSLRLVVDSADNVPSSMRIHLTQHQVSSLVGQCQGLLFDSNKSQLPPPPAEGPSDKGNATDSADIRGGVNIPEPLPPLIPAVRLLALTMFNHRPRNDACSSFRFVKK